MDNVIYDKSLLVRQDSADTSQDDELVYFDGKISDSTYDTYYTRMTPKALKSFADDADAGVNVLPEHNKRGQPIGRSVSAKYNPKTESVTARFYIQTGLNLTEAGYADTDSYAKALTKGTARDLSVGARPKSVTCDLCRSEMDPDPFFGWMFPRCSEGHYPGKKVKDPETKKVKRVTASINDATLTEFSIVSSGANKNAQVIKMAQNASKEGALTEEHLDRLQLTFNLTRADLDIDPATIVGDDDMATDRDQKDQDQTDEKDEGTKASESTELKDLRAEVENLRRENKEFSEFISEYEEDTDDRINTIQRLKDEVSQLDALKADKEALEEDLEDRNDEIERLQKRIERNRKAEDNAERYQDLLVDAREAYMRAYVRAKGVKVTSDGAEAERNRIEKNENYDLITAKTRKLRFEYQEETSAVRERRKADRKKDADADLYDI